MIVVGLLLGFALAMLISCAPAPPPQPSTTIELDWIEAYPVVKVNGGRWRWLDPGDRVGDAIPMY